MKLIPYNCNLVKRGTVWGDFLGFVIDAVPFLILLAGGAGIAWSVLWCLGKLVELLVTKLA